MPRQVASVIENNFAKGLMTEATALQYPENSVVEAQDCVFDVLGSVSRRLGFDYEYGYATKTIDRTGCVINTYLWKNVTGDGLVSFVVVQVGNLLYFYNADTGAQSLSGGAVAATINLTTYQTGGDPPRLHECSFADGLSRLYVANPSINNIFITYNAGVFTATQYSLLIRDFEGVYDNGYDITFKPLTLPPNDNHRYNLYNQGWDATKINTWFTAFGNYPSSADVWWVYKDLNEVFNPGTTYANNSRGNSPAPKGRFLLNVYAGNRDAASGLSGISSTNSGNARTSVVAFFAGRVWHSGISANKFNSKLYFSQIISGDDQIGRCFQANDPTSEDTFDLLPDDGGVISIPEAGTIYKMVAVQNSLLVFAYRGVWMITGSTGLGFTANDYVVSKLSSIRTISGTSFVDINGFPMWWNSDGIWSIQQTKDGNGLAVTSVTRGTIQSFYDDIPNASKTNARGSFDPLEQTAYWLYRSTAASVIDDQYEYDRVLVLNMITGAFYPWSISPGVDVHGLILIDGTGGATTENVVITDIGDTVVDDLGNIVVSYELTNASISPKIKYLSSRPNGVSFGFTWSETIDPAFTDWVSAGQATPYESYVITGYKLYGKALTEFKTDYVLAYHEGNGAFYIQAVWDFAVQTSTGRYSVKQLCTFDDSAYSNNHKKLKIRGQGRTLQYKISSHDSNPFLLLGWAVQGSAGALP